MMRLVTRAMLWRSVAASLIVGGVLFTINQDPSALAHRWTAAMWRQLGISMLVPFVVSLIAAILARREMLAATANPSAGAASDRTGQR